MEFLMLDALTGEYLIPAVDYCSRDGARLLADQIESFWKDRGYWGIKAEVYQIPRGNYRYCYGVKSNLHMGYPPKGGI